MKKIATVLGARPQFIKAAAVSRAVRKHDNLEEVIIHTGQHYDVKMSDVFFEELEIPKPDYFLGVAGLSHGAMTGQMMEKIEKVLMKEEPDMVLIYGDTNSTMAGALAAVKLHIPVAHVEAGLRSFNMKMPEEINRIVADSVSSLLFAPTDKAVENLKKEGVELRGARIIRTGDVMYDVALFYSRKAVKPDFDLPEKFAVATVHRAENTDDLDRLKSILLGLSRVAEELIPVVFPVHPRTRNRMASLGDDFLGSLSERLILTEPVGYLNMVYLLKEASLVLTDSGGLQKEAFFFENPCVTLRDETEWVELVEGGYNVLAGADSEKILSFAKEMLSKNLNFDVPLYGDGRTAEHIVEEVGKFLRAV